MGDVLPISQRSGELFLPLEAAEQSRNEKLAAVVDRINHRYKTRVIKYGKVGYSYTEQFKETTFRNIVDEALENAKYIEDNEIVILENHPAINTKLEVYSEALDKVDVIVDYLYENEK